MSKSIKVMLLGIAILLFGGFNLNYYPGDYGNFITIIGLIIVGVGFFVKIDK